MEVLDDLLATTARAGASDLHLKVGSPPLLRVEGRLQRLDVQPLEADLAWQWVDGILSAEQRQAFDDRHSAYIAYELAGGDRFRVAVFRQAGTPAFVFRRIRQQVPRLDELRLPEVVAELCKRRAGLVLITGATGSGKSTTLAAMVDEINRTSERTICTIEDPVEFVHHDHTCHITQREIGIDAADFKDALVEALRQDPDVILIGEMREPKTIATALLAAETGHLVFSTLHTGDAVETVHRILMTYPEERQNAVRIQLAAALTAVVSLRLVPRADGLGRVPAVEVMVVTDHIRELIATPGRLDQIRQAIADGGTPYRMQTFDQSLSYLCEEELVTFEEAMAHATRPADFALLHRGVISGKEEVKSSPFWRTGDRK